MKVDRLVSIIMILLDKKRIGAQELADMFEVSPRTIYRDIDTINMAGIPVCSVPGVGGGFEIMQKYKIDKKVFSTADLSAILMGLSNLSTMIRGDELVHALAKVKSFIPADTAKDIELKANQVPYGSVCPKDAVPLTSDSGPNQFKATILFQFIMPWCCLIILQMIIFFGS